MYKVTLLLKAVSDLEAMRMSREWARLPWREAGGTDAPLRHLHNRSIPGDMPIENAPSAAFDAADEFWFSDERSARRWFGSETFQGFWELRCAPLLPGAPSELSGTPHVLWERKVSEARDPVKIITLPIRRDGLDMDEFAHHWIHVHSKLALDGPGTRGRLQRLEPCPMDNARITGFPIAPFDGAGTIEFAESKDLQTEFESEHYRTVMAPDEPRFTDPSRSCALMVDPLVL